MLVIILYIVQGNVEDINRIPSSAMNRFDIEGNSKEFAAVWSGATVVSAGEIEISKDGGIWCGGKSITLSVSSRPYQDMILVEKMLFRQER